MSKLMSQSTHERGKRTVPNSRDGILYSRDDQAKIACHDCRGCQHCCENMDDTIILDPYDVWQLTHRLTVSGGGKVSFELLISEDGPLALGNYDGMILPHIKMVATDREDIGVCPFLSDGRCSIHFCRPGICRLYPLGRIYSEKDGKTEIGYIILDEKLGCNIQDTYNIKISDWLGISDERYDDFLGKWHKLKKQIVQMIESGELSMDSKEYADMLTQILRTFYFTPYGPDFFKEFDERFETHTLIL